MDKVSIKAVGLILFLFLPAGCEEKKELDPVQILQKSIDYHDPNGHWANTSFHVHIQEPRISNPGRYSILKLNRSFNSFELIRNREEHVSHHIIDSLGNSSVLLDGEKNFDSLLIGKYRLDPQRNAGYKKFYELLYGLPMSLKDFQKNIVRATETIFNDKDSYKIEMELNESIISNHWNIYISRLNKEIIGVEIIFKDEPEKGERLYFDGKFMINDMSIPRIRHWHELHNDNYLGSDLIIKSIP